MLTSMIFFPEKTFYEKPEAYGLRYEDVHIPSTDGAKLHGWYLPAEGEEKGALLFLHGNAGNISGRLHKAQGWVKRGFSVLLIDYRGYGKSSGEIRHGEDIVQDSEAALRWLTETKKIPLGKLIIYGESLGTHPAIRIATSHKAAALILEAPFTSFYALADVHYPFVPKQMIKDFEFSNLSGIDKLKTPVFILHGMQDEVCPYAMAGELFEKAPEPKAFFSIPNGWHNDLPVAAGEDFWNKPYEFVMKRSHDADR